MKLNTISPGEGAKKEAVRLGRGMGSGLGKTCGRGHKGQKARAGGYHKVGFEGGQMPLQRRLPKFGFRSAMARVTQELRISELEKLPAEVVDLVTLREVDLIGSAIKAVKIFGEGKLTRKFTVRGIKVSKSARAAIEAAGGLVE